MLEISQLTIGLSVIPERGTPGFDCVLQNLPNGRNERLYPRGADATCLAFWGNTGAVQHLADIDIAKPGDDTLIQQR